MIRPAQTLLLVAVVAAACTGTQPREPKPEAAPERSAAAPVPGLLAAPRAFAHEGEIFVALSEAGAKAFEEQRRFAASTAHEFAGPGGETVYVETLAGDQGASARAFAAWSSAHVEYHEHERDGRIYVVGSAASLRALRESGHLEITRTLIGEGPDGETVVLEVDKERPFLVERLHRSFLARRATEK